MVDTLTKVQIRIYSNKYSTNKTVAVKIITSEIYSPLLLTRKRRISNTKINS